MLAYRFHQLIHNMVREYQLRCRQDFVIWLPSRAACAGRKGGLEFVAALRVYYILESKKAVNWDFAKAPTFVAAIWPPLNKLSVGMPRTPNF